MNMSYVSNKMQVNILLLCVSCLNRVLSYPDGQVADSCQSLTPNHSNFESETINCPYKVSVNSNTFTPGQTITVTLRAAGNASEFQGFMLQAREVEGRTAVGHFTSINTNQSRALKCFHIENSTLSQASAHKKSQFEATWEAPANSSLGDIQFVVTFVQDYTTFWTMVNSSTVRSIDKQLPSNTSSTTTRPASSQQASSFPPPSRTTSKNKYTTTRPAAASEQQSTSSSFPNSCHMNIHLMQLTVTLLAVVLHFNVF